MLVLNREVWKVEFSASSASVGVLKVHGHVDVLLVIGMRTWGGYEQPVSQTSKENM